LHRGDVERVREMKHFFYAVYVLFYTGAVFMAGVFIGQMLYRSRVSRQRRSEKRAWSSDSESNGKVGVGEPKVAVTGRRR
jgi:hypothetical protein